ncbi:hypothetical protein [Nocardioides albus]|uniref:Uncharacterized protein n=1 Tax=Nocardioides albus TaxID=1841 RepID=A0A7W5FBH8_9ACTN|nr:hypothetical protein [Nocardioides albus]MBB3092230.1 hypothetical protein [Nocardioides albus]GGU46677.1 hypothetical protein GCM10007979_52270 [Nocardioides albus]
MGTPQVDRRFFLTRVGVLGALAAAGTAVPGVARAVTTGPADPLVGVVSKLLAELARDTLNGLAVFVVPGPDGYSRTQGTPRSEPGAMEAKTPDFLIESLDNYVPMPDQIAAAVGRALANGLADVPIVVPNGLPLIPNALLADLDDVIKLLLRNDSALPLSAVIALLLNTQAVRVDPSSAVGPHLSPFSRLSFAKKAEVFELLEHADPQLVKAIDAELPEPLKGTVSGILQFIAGALLEFSAFGTFCEWSTFDADKLTVSKRPVGWDLAKYDPGSMDGWDEFKGYYQGRQKVSAR